MPSHRPSCERTPTRVAPSSGSGTHDEDAARLRGNVGTQLQDVSSGV